jgi:transaldolase
MSILLDSASLADVTRAARLGFVTGITTNPALMRGETGDPLAHLGELLAAMPSVPVYYQPSGAYGDQRAEAEKAWALDEGRVVLKVPATPDGAALAGALIAQGIPVALTAAQSPLAMVVAESLGCTVVIPYVDRALRDPTVESRLVEALREVRRAGTRIVAASVKSTGQVLDAVRAGADAVTAPLAVLDELLRHPVALAADQAFQAAYVPDSPR